MVFTIPQELNPLVFQNQKLLYSLLLQAAGYTLLELSRDSKFLGATIGVTSVLHTWGQNLSFHPHVHCIVPGGGRSPFCPFEKKVLYPGEGSFQKV
ncbi:MAG: transposase [Peptococcaceae bacterium]|nr:transposase [Peptococcaceae bacterium]